jgi:hypothetical protein
MCVSFVFGEVDSQLKQELRNFWAQHRLRYQAELKSFLDELSSNLESSITARPALSRQPAAISRDRNGCINGIVFVRLRELDPSLELGSHAYFQSMFIAPQFRSPKLANQLYQVFLDGFSRPSSHRDHRAHYLLAENTNPALRKSFMRRYFCRRGFRLLGYSQLGGEVWARELPTKFVF